MSKSTSLIVVFLLISISLFSTNLASGIEVKNVSSEQYEKGYRYNIQGWIYLHIEGEPYERGYQHGYLLSNEIIDMLNRWSNSIHKHNLVSKISSRSSDLRYYKISEIWWNFCRNQCNIIYWNKFPEEYQQEIEGIVDGVNAKGGKLLGRPIDYKDILAMNQMYEFMTKLSYLIMGIHPLRSLIHELKKVEPEISPSGIMSFLKDFLIKEPPHHCNGFIATGDATTDGQIVFSHSTISGPGRIWWNYYISLRWNVILDVQPSTGNRVIMSSSPGIIWSDEDYYQNDNGIVLLETTVPQGVYDTRNLPLSVRARNAIQYGNSIDDVVYHLRHKNDGCMNAVWLIGDTKTGEIARLDLGYTAYALWRTDNGFYWSANNPIDIRVRLEKYKPGFSTLMDRLVYMLTGVKYFAFSSVRYIPSDRDLKYEELGNKYYGEIDVDIVKEIMTSKKIVEAITDVKITDTKLLEQNGLWAYFGNPTKPLNYTSYDSKEQEEFSVNPTGWVKIFGVPRKNNFNLTYQETYNRKQTNVTWEFDTKFSENHFTTSSSVKEDTLISTTSEGKMYAFDKTNGDKIWEATVGQKPTTPSVKDDMVFVGHSEGLKAFNTRGAKKWEISTSDVVSEPVVIDDSVIFGDNIGNLYALSVENGKELWKLKFPYEVYTSTSYNKNIYLTSNKSCYAVNVKDQEVIWNYTTNGLIYSSPLFKDDTVYFGSWDNFIYALNADDGSLKWKYETGWGVETTPAISDNKIFAGSHDNNLYALNAENGELEWMFACNAGIHSSPVVYGDFVFFGSDDGRLYAVNKTTGESEWYFAPKYTIDDDLYNYITTPILSTPVVDEGIVYFGADGNIYALDAQTFETPQKEIEENEIPQETWLFIILSLLIVVLFTVLYLYYSKKRV